MRHKILYYLRLLSALLSAAGFMAPAAAAETAAAVSGQNHSASPFPILAAAAGSQKEVFSYALESGFIRLSFADMAAAGKKAPGRQAGGMGKPPKQIYGLIAIDLKPGWKTYWRNPGSSGVAPKIELDGGAKAEILFPAPHNFQTAEDWSYGYKTQAQLPFRIILPAQKTQDFYSGNLIIGLCKDLCMPQKIPFQFSAALPPQSRERANIAAALKALPRAADKNFQLISAQMVKNTLRLSLRAPQAEHGSAPKLFLDGGALQIGIAHPLPQTANYKPAANHKNHAEKTPQPRAKAAVRLYQAPLLFGEAQAGMPIFYTAALQDGRAVSGTIRIALPKAK